MDRIEKWGGVGGRGGVGKRVEERSRGSAERSGEERGGEQEEQEGVERA